MNVSQKGGLQLRPEWIGELGYVQHRCGISDKELAMEMRVSGSYLSRILNEKRTISLSSKLKVMNALRSCVESRGLKYEEVFPYTRPAEGSDP